MRSTHEFAPGEIGFDPLVPLRQGLKPLELGDVDDLGQTSGLADGLQPDEVFDYLVQRAWDNAGPQDTPQLRAAALAVVAYLFEICEVFERE